MSYTHLNALTQEKRMTLFFLHQAGFSLREMNRRFNRSQPQLSLSRELKRNNRVLGCYCDCAAQSFAETRQSIPRHHRCHSNPKLLAYVTDKRVLA